MVQSTVLPCIVKIKNLGASYKWRGLTSQEYYNVICYDMKHLLLTNAKGDKPYKVRWEDVELIRSEKIDFSRNASNFLETQSLKQAVNKLGSVITRWQKKPPR